jgi:hypothetical protein
MVRENKLMCAEEREDFSGRKHPRLTCINSPEYLKMREEAKQQQELAAKK